MFTLTSTTLLLVFLLPTIYLLLAQRQSRRDPSKPSPPPHVYSLVPWLGSGLALGRNPDGFVQRAISAHGPIFSFHAAGKKMILITSPDAIAYVYKQSKAFNFSQIRLSFHRTIFGCPEDMDDERIKAEIFPAHKRTLQPGALQSLVTRFSTSYLKQVRGLEHGQVTDPRGLWDLIFDASAETYFDSDTFPTSAIREPFVGFDTDFARLAGDLPSFMTRDAVAHRTRTISILQRWIEENASPIDVPREELEGKLSMPVAELLRTSTEIGNDLQTTSAIVLAGFWAMAANAPAAAVWALLLLADHPDTLARVRAELAAALARPETRTIDEVLTDLPLLASDAFAFTTAVIQETLRWSSSVFSMRVATEDAVLPFPAGTAGTFIRKGDRVFCSTRSVHVNDEAYEDPQVWDPERYMGETHKDGKGSTTDYLPWGGGVSMCEGRHFAMYELRIIIHAFFHHVDLVRTSKVKLELDWSRGIGMGVLHPMAGYKAELRKRAC